MYSIVRHTVLQGLVTFMSPVEAFAMAIKFFDWQKIRSFPSEALDGLILKGQRSDCSHAVDSTAAPQTSFAHLIQF